MGCQIGALPRTPFPASRDFPSRGNEGSEEKNSESYTSRTISEFSPFGGERSEPVSRMLNMLYDIESQSRNADFILIALRAIPQPSGQRPVKLKNLPAEGRSILRTFPFEPFEPFEPFLPIMYNKAIIARS